MLFRAWSSLSFRIDNLLFTGDSYLPDYKLISSFPNSDKLDAENSLLRLKLLSKGYDICPGHGDIIKYKD